MFGYAKIVTDPKTAYDRPQERANDQARRTSQPAGRWLATSDTDDATR